MTAEKVGRPSVSTIEHPFLFVIEGASLDVPDSKGGDPLSDKMSDFNITVAGTVAYALHIESGYFTHKDGSRFDVVVRVTDVFHNLRLCLFTYSFGTSVPIEPYLKSWPYPCSPVFPMALYGRPKTC